MPKYSVFIIFLLLACFFKNARAEEALTWQDCVKEAAKNHPDLISAQESVKQSESDKKISASALLPQIDSNAGASQAKSASADKAGKSFSYGLTGTQLLFDGAKSVNKVNFASENIKAAQYNYKFISSEVRLRLRTAFINVLKQQELLKITQEIYNIRRNNFELITLRYESGMEHKGALLTAEANLSQAEFEIAQAKRALEAVQRQLLKEMGRARFLPLSVEGNFEISGLILEQPDFEVIARKNPSLGKFIARKNAASFNIKSVRADFYPELSAKAGASKSGARFLPGDEQWNAGLTLTLPIFEGGLRSAELYKKKSLFYQAEADERGAKDSIIVALSQTWAELLDAVDAIGVQNKFLAAAEERARISEAQYSLGLIQFDDWTIIEDGLVRAKKTFLDIQANALLAQANWVQAKGDTLEYAD
ncbi:MAG: TolC family protein [Candidatus Omnitrophota bacterium]